MAIGDNFPQVDNVAPGYHALPIVPSDSVDLLNITRGIYVGSGGDIAVIMLGGETVTFAAVPTGSLLPIHVRRVKSTGTTASSLVQIWG